MPSGFGLGEAFALGSAMAWAIGVILYRRLGDYLPPLPLNFIKNLLVLGMLAVALPLVHGLALPQISATELGLAIASGLIGLALADTLYLKALNQLGAGRMGIIGNLYSPFVIALSFVFLGERLGPLQVVGFVLVAAGVLLVSVRRASETTPAARASAVLLGVFAILLMAIAIIMIKRVLEAQPLVWISLIRMASALLGLLAIAALRGELSTLNPLKMRVDWRLLLVAAFIGQFLSTLFWLGGYKYTSAMVAAILNESASIFIVLLAWLWLKEPMDGRRAGGVGLALAGVGLMVV
ncbi:MAG: DMT family transporter [Aquimonas sp.]|nr:DMT family transporter [Aquimonas sp.]